MAVPTTSWSELTPADTDLISTVDNTILTIKTSIREIIAVDHIFSNTGQGTTWGFHNKVTLYEQVSDPDAVADTTLLFVKDVAGKPELHFKSEGGTVMQITSAGQIVAGMTDEIRMFYGLLTEIPTGWALCDGTSGRTNMLAKFVRGINTTLTEPEANSGGADSVTLTYANMPNHTHILGTTGSGHKHNILKLDTYGSSGARYIVYEIANRLSIVPSNTGNEGEHSHDIGYSGSNASITFDNRPAYYELAFITRT